MSDDFIGGLILGIMMTTTIVAVLRWYVRRSVAKAVALTTDREARRSIEVLSNEEGRRAGQIDRLQERIAVLERITTDTGFRTAREIDALGTR